MRLGFSFGIDALKPIEGACSKAAALLPTSTATGQEPKFLIMGDCCHQKRITCLGRVCVAK